MATSSRQYYPPPPHHHHHHHHHHHDARHHGALDHDALPAAFALPVAAAPEPSPAFAVPAWSPPVQHQHQHPQPHPPPPQQQQELHGWSPPPRQPPPSTPLSLPADAPPFPLPLPLPSQLVPAGAPSARHASRPLFAARPPSPPPAVAQPAPLQAWDASWHVGPPLYPPAPPADVPWAAVVSQSERHVFADPLAAANAPLEPDHDALATSGAARRGSLKHKAVRVPSSFVERQQKLKVSKRKGPLQEKQREKTHTMRKSKRICVRCRFYKSGCDEGDPCEKCSKIVGHARSFKEPCYREHLEDTSLVRRCNGREHQDEAEFLAYDWVHNSQLYEMEILWNLPGFGPIPHAEPMRVDFRPYTPRRGPLDTVTSLWSNTKGEVRSVEQPAYAIYDTANLVPAFERYFAGLQPAIEGWVFSRIQQDRVAYLTYHEVVRMRTTKPSKVLDLAMRLQCLSVVSQGYGTVWSNDIPGIQEYDYRILGRSEYEAYDRRSRDRPVPGAITHQMDVAAVKYLKKLEKMLHKELASLTFKPKIKPWYELFLAFYVIFWNLDYIHRGAQGYMKSKNGTLIENQVNSVVSNQIKKWEFASSVLLYHWRATLRGYSPFKLARDNPEELRERGHVDSQGFDYMVKMAQIFSSGGLEQYQPPLTGFAASHYSMSSDWITRIFREAGA